jgi:hypothetical protein
MVKTGPGEGHHKQRYYPRIKAEILLAFKSPAAGDDEACVVKTKTIGLGGLMIELDHPLPVGAAYHLDLLLGEEHMKVNATVVYARKETSDVFQMGFGFTDLSENDRERLLNFFLEEYERLPPEAL